MELHGNEVILNRREKKTLGLLTRRISALVIGEAWQVANTQTKELLETLRQRPQETKVHVGIYGIVTQRNHIQDHISALEKQRNRLATMEHEAWAISQETLPAQTATSDTNL